MADGQDAIINDNLAGLQNRYRILQRELLELEVIDSELESIKKHHRIYVKRGGNLFFLDSNPKRTVSEYKKLLDVKKKEMKNVEGAIREKSR